MFIILLLFFLLFFQFFKFVFYAFIFVFLFFLSLFLNSIFNFYSTFLEFGLYSRSSWEIRRPLPVCGKRLHLKSLLCLIEVAWVGVLAQGEVLKPSPDSGEGIPSFNDFCHRSKGNKQSVNAARDSPAFLRIK